MIRYLEFAAKGWSIGSGPAESCCKTLTKRLKGSGMRWDADNAEAVMALESLRESGLWKAYWQRLVLTTSLRLSETFARPSYQQIANNLGHTRPTRVQSACPTN
jgi:hypothetical protein